MDREIKEKLEEDDLYKILNLDKDCDEAEI
jgi:hypothetical protein